MRGTALLLTLALTACGSSERVPAEPPPISRATARASPATPAAVPRTVHIRFRRRGTPDELEDHVDILSIDAKREANGVRLTHIVGYSDNDGRDRRFAISAITQMEASGGITLDTPEAIMYWLRCEAGIATEADHLAARIAASKAEVPEGIDMLARGLCLNAWLRYVDAEGAVTTRQILITDLAGFRPRGQT